MTKNNMWNVLGLDIGASSLGWALVQLPMNGGTNGKIIKTGVHIFQAGVENFDSNKEKSKNEPRRKSRGSRRRSRRLSQRKHQLAVLLRENNMFSSNIGKETSDPYELRKKGLEEKLSREELGRVFYHLCKRRGFATARKTKVVKKAPKNKDAEEKKSAADSQKKEEKKVDILANISELADSIEKSGEKTLGAYLSSLRSKNAFERIRARHTRRSMYKDEFELLWSCQAKFYPNLLTDELKQRVESLIFHQRPIYWKESSIGQCELEPGEKRCLRADRLAQEFRLLQEVNNLKYFDTAANQEIRVAETLGYQKLIDAMKEKKELTFDQIRKALGLESFVRFNLESGKKSSGSGKKGMKKAAAGDSSENENPAQSESSAENGESGGLSKLKGMETDSLLKKYFGPSLWKKKSEEEKNEIVRILCERRDKSGNYIDEECLREIIVNEWGVTDAENADNLLDVTEDKNFPKGRLSLSRKAIENLLPFMRQGRLFMGDSETDALHAAGYLRPDERPWKQVDFLPPLELKHLDPQKIADDSVRQAIAALKNLPAITNPVVRQCVSQVRKLVNAIIREYGRPDKIRVELAREAKANSQQRKAIQDSNKKNRNENEEADKFIQENGYTPSFDRRLRYRLWKEQKEFCPYTIKQISTAQLFGSETDIDHIIPRAQGGEDARTNKVVCFRSANEEKGNQTPRQWLKDADPVRYEKVLEAAKNLPYIKRMRFSQQEGNLENFVDRQLNDTKYASRYVKQYLNLLYDKVGKDDSLHVQSIRGNQTAALRHLWGLNSILHEDIVPTGLRPDQKNRADHRHHAVDALVIALTDAAIIQKLATWDKMNRISEMENKPLPPWPSEKQFRSDVAESIRSIIVSHAPNRRVRGPLCEDTKYGLVKKRAEDDDRNLVRRKTLADLSPSEVLNIRDKAIRQKVLEYLEKEHGIRLNEKETKLDCTDSKLKAALSVPFYLHPEEKRTPIKKVRLLISNKSAIPLYPGRDDSPRIIPGNTHHVRIFEWIEKNKKGEDKLVREVFFTTQLEVNSRNLERLHLIRSQIKELSAELSQEERELKIRKIRRNAALQFPLIRRTLSPEESRGHDAKFIMSLCKGEVVEIFAGKKTTQLAITVWTPVILQMEI